MVVYIKSAHCTCILNIWSLCQFTSIKLKKKSQMETRAWKRSWRGSSNFLPLTQLALHPHPENQRVFVKDSIRGRGLSLSLVRGISSLSFLATSPHFHLWAQAEISSSPFSFFLPHVLNFPAGLFPNSSAHDQLLPASLSCVSALDCISTVGRVCCWQRQRKRENGATSPESTWIIYVKSL